MPAIELAPGAEGLRRSFLPGTRRFDLPEKRARYADPASALLWLPIRRRLLKPSLFGRAWVSPVQARAPRPRSTPHQLPLSAL